MRIDRRSFIKAAAAVPFLLQVQPSGRRISPIGVQLYTIRKEVEKDFEGALARVAAVGYREVEFAGYFDRSPREVRALLEKHGLAGVSAHVGYGSLGEKWPAVIDAALAIGHKFLIVPSIDGASRKEPDSWQRIAERFNRAGEACKAAGIQFAYHNHEFEFEPTETGKLPYEILLESTDPKLVSMQMDLCWTIAAGQDPVAYFRRYPGRFSSVHVKDLKKLPAPKAAERPQQADVGHGVIDWGTLLAQSWSAGVRHYFVEHDNPPEPFDSIDRSFRYLNALRFSDAAGR